MEDMRETLTGWAKDTEKNAGMIVILGVLTVIAGFLSLVMPWVSGVGVAFVVGFAMVVGGVARLIAVFSAGSFGRGTLAFIGGALTLLAGVILVARPGVGLAVLTMMIGAYLLVDGIFGAVLAFSVRPEKGWGWMFVQRRHELPARHPAAQGVAPVRALGDRYAGRDQHAVRGLCDDLHRFRCAEDGQENRVGPLRGSTPGSGSDPSRAP